MAKGWEVGWRGQEETPGTTEDRDVVVEKPGANRRETIRNEEGGLPEIPIFAVSSFTRVMDQI